MIYEFSVIIELIIQHVFCWKFNDDPSQVNCLNFYGALHLGDPKLQVDFC